jgi:hypothetical protein
MAGQAHGKKKAKVVNMLSPTPTQVDVDPIFFSQTSSPSQTLIAPAPAAHSQSKTWKSNDTKEKDQYSRLSTLLHHFVPESPFVPRSYTVWVQHRAMMNAMQMDNMKKDIAIKQSRNSVAEKVTINPAFNGKKYDDNRSAVLAHETIWASWSTPTDEHPEALWPDRSEFQYEGDDRAKSDVGRFLPLPRKPGKEMVNWKSREQVQPYRPLDHVGMFQADGTPDMEMRQRCVSLHWEGEIEDMAAILLGTDLIAELE